MKAYTTRKIQKCVELKRACLHDQLKMLILLYAQR